MSVKKYYQLAKNKLFPICRSITGNGTKKTLRIIKLNFPSMKIHKVKSGTKVFDWKVPPEWNIKNAYIEDKFKKKIIDFKNHNLHIVGYSVPTSKIVTKKNLLRNIHSLKEMPNAIPYITSYYKRYWGFCTTHKQKKDIIKKYKKTDKFKILIESEINYKGNLNYGEILLKGSSNEEILISTYICHPSMANNELSGPIVAMSLINFFKKKKLKKSIRFVFIPETIGSITYLSKNLNHLKKNIVAGYNLTCIGDEKNYGCMLTKYENTLADKCLLKAFKNLSIRPKIYPFTENGSDERQYNSHGIDLPVASIFRSKYGTFKEYHTSLDNFKFVTLKGVNGGFKIAKEAIKLIQNTTIPKTLVLCEPQMGKRGLYPSLSKSTNRKYTKNIMNFLQYSNGKNDLEDISKKINCNFNETKNIYKVLRQKKIIN